LEAAERPAARRSTGRSCDERSWLVVEKLLVAMDGMLREQGVPWLLVWQGDDDPAFHAENRRRLEQIAHAHDLPYYDPSPAFVADYRLRHEPFRIPDDGHWYASGHRVVGSALARIWREMRSPPPRPD
jgi:hypothetical protein